MATRPRETAGRNGDFVPIHKKRTFEEIIDQLQQMILAGTLKAGDRLPNERALSEMLGVSRPSLREALRVFEALELIEVRPGVGAASGSIIRREAGGALTSLLRMHLALDHFVAHDLIEVRRVIEDRTVRAASTNRTPEHLARLHGLLDAMDERPIEASTFRQLDAQFHIAIADAAGNPLMARLMEALRDPIVYNLMDAMTDEEWVEAFSWIAPQHDTILQAIEARKPGLAAKAMAEHLRFYGD